MRVLHIDTEMTWRGGENQLRLLLEGLAREPGVESHLAVRPGSAAAKKLAPLGSLLALPMRGGFDPRAAWTIARYCREHKIDVIDAHTGNAHTIGLLAKAAVPRVKLVVHRRVDFVPHSGVINKLKYLTPKVDRYIAISHAIKRILVAYGVPDERVRVARSAVPGGAMQAFDKAEERAQFAKVFGIDPALTFIGNTAALTDQKGHDVLLRALKILKDRGVKAHVFIAGAGANRDALEQLRIDLDLEYDATFLGFIEEVPRFLASMDMMTMPSNLEGLGTAILDAIHADLCVVATNAGGIPEMIEHGVSGLLSPVGDAPALAANLALAAGDAALRQRLSAAARAHAEREFSVEAMVASNLATYRELVAP